LKTMLNTDLFTVLGDLSQGIHSYRGITDWNQVIKEVFPNGNCNFATLEQSYRTTVEIMNLASQVIQHSPSPGIVLAKPVVRHGEKPQWCVFHKDNEFISPLVEQINRVKNDGFKTMAIIGKSMDDCKKIIKLLENNSELKAKLLSGEEDIKNADLVIVPSYIAKGLEFDVVFIVNIDDEYTYDDLDIKLLYVAMTRPLHRLYLFTKENKIPLLEKISSDYLAK
jgi:DNA helicase-2/ATP-dependent DNA helicase PcrA